MLHRDENGMLISADNVKDITDGLEAIEGKIIYAAEKGKDNLNDEEKAKALAMLDDLKALMGMLTPELKNETNPIQLIGLVKQLMKIKSLAEKLHNGNQNDD